LPDLAALIKVFSYLLFYQNAAVFADGIFADRVSIASITEIRAYYSLRVLLENFQTRRISSSK